MINESSAACVDQPGGDSIERVAATTDQRLFAIGGRSLSHRPSEIARTATRRFSLLSR